MCRAAFSGASLVSAHSTVYMSDQMRRAVAWPFLL